MNKNNSCLFSALLLLATSLASPLITAADENSGWSHSVARHLVTANINATAGVTTPGGSAERPIDLNFSDRPDALDSAFAAIYLGRNGRVSILADFSYLKLAFHDSKPVRAGHAAMTQSCYPENTYGIMRRTIIHRTPRLFIVFQKDTGYVQS